MQDSVFMEYIQFQGFPHRASPISKWNILGAVHALIDVWDIILFVPIFLDQLKKYIIMIHIPLF